MLKPGGVEAGVGVGLAEMPPRLQPKQGLTVNQAACYVHGQDLQHTVQLKQCLSYTFA